MKGFPPPSSPPSSLLLLPAPSHLWCLAIEPRTLYPLSTQCISALLPQQGAVLFFFFLPKGDWHPGCTGYHLAGHFWGQDSSSLGGVFVGSMCKALRLIPSPEENK